MEFVFSGKKKPETKIIMPDDGTAIVIIDQEKYKFAIEELAEAC